MRSRLRTRGLLLLCALAAAACDGVPTAPAGAVLEVTLPWELSVRFAAPETRLGMECVLVLPDGTRRDVSTAARVRSRSGTVSGADCRSLAVRRSGVDTLEVTWRGLRARVPLALALPPRVVEGRLGRYLQADSFGGGDAWAPTLRRNGRRQLELYASRYAGGKSRLVRLVSDDGERFRYDGVVFTPAADDCTPFGTGFENVAVVPRADGPGWRMFFAAGANGCYGWQVHSAVSADERAWTVEPGVRLSNGDGLFPLSSGNPYWPQGEGMVIDRLPDGTWRMITGGVPPVAPYDSRFQIIEWRSRDQLAWTYAGPVLTTAQMPDAGDGSVYSPTIREFAPGVFRMLFTADNRNGPGPNRSSLWSAVSLDMQHWQVEGELLGAEGSDLYYATLVDERLVFVRRDPGQAPRLSLATVRMP